MRKRHQKKLTRKQRRIKNRVTLRTLFLVAITLIFNTYAWFLYLTTVSANLTAHVEAWHVQFKVDNEVVEREFPIVISHAYPGMSDLVKTVTVINDGEKDADIGYAIKSVRVFNDIFIATDQMSSGETIPTGATSMTSAQLLTKLQNDYPFNLSVTLTNGTLVADGQDTLTISFTWAYESGDDDEDTFYGTTAYNFYAANPGKEAIELVIKLLGTQHPDVTPTPTAPVTPEPTT